MKTLTTEAELDAFCTMAQMYPFVTIDTEFLRERTYYSKLCLLQIAVPGTCVDDAVLVDPLSPDMRLEPLYRLFRDTSVVKVFHAARQDLEIFWNDAKIFPTPLFDTQVAAMVCGFGEQVGYETLVRKIVKEQVDKSSRFTDWSRRPLTDAQKTYAIEDVTHLRGVYLFLKAELERTDREAWVVEETQSLTDPAIYDVVPSEAWRRIKTRTSSNKFLAYVRELAAFREQYAQTRNVPRNRVYKDDAMVELASTKPTTQEDLSKSRLLLREARKGEISDGILNAIKTVNAMDPETFPKLPKSNDKLQVNPALADLLRVLLKAKSEGSDVAQKMIANTSELDALAGGQRDLPSLKGWRMDVFGSDALRLCEGRVGLAVKGNKVKLFEL
jgi:ribonuclease D|tara:strand:- start:102 stop:1259 length:1158 start_codon:yes stop_codon:yes gene_type:complete